MRSAIRFTVAFCCLVVWTPQKDFVARTPHSDRLSSTPNSELELVTRVVAQEYCNEDQLRIALELTFKNKGHKRIILYKYSVGIVQTLVSQNLEAALAKQYEEETQYFVNLIVDPDQIQGSAPGDSFVILQANDSYRANTRVILFLPRSDKSIRRKLRPGRYYLQVVVPTWFLSDDVARKLSKRWKSAGLLWTSDILSQAMPFEIEDRDSTRKCS
jgi:hypothetical protein